METDMNNILGGAISSIYTDQFNLLMKINDKKNIDIDFLEEIIEKFKYYSANYLNVIRLVTPKQPQFKWVSGESERLSLMPIRHSDIWSIRQKIEALHWTAQEVDLTKDRADWKNMKEHEKNFVKMQLAFFSRVDIDVLENINTNFVEEVDCLEAQMAYTSQAAQECTHAESYALQISAVLNGAEEAETLNAVRHFPIIEHMRNWVMKWTDKKLPIGERLVAWAFIEGVMFQGPFCALQSLRERNLLPGITQYNLFISRDEAIHTLYSCLLISTYLVNQPDVNRVAKIFTEGMELVDELITESLPVSALGISDTLMKEYVRHQANCVLVEMGYKILYNYKNPFPFMDKMLLNEVAKTNFFEFRPSQYQSITNSEASLLAIDDSEVDF